MEKLILSETFRTLLENNKSSFSDLLLYEGNPNTTKCNYITLRKGEKITYHPKPENQKFNDNNDWRREGRQEIKPIALIRLLFGEEKSLLISNNEIEEISSIIKNYDSELKMLKSTFEKIYSDNFCDDWVRNSCMSGKSECVDFYNERKDIFTPYVFVINGEIIGRSIKVKHSEGTYFDRIYFKNEEHQSLIKNFLIEEGETVKRHQDYSSKTQFQNKEKDCFYQSIYVETNISNCDWIPYMDTLTYYDGSNMTNQEDDAIYKFDSTNGDVEEQDITIYCEDTRESVNEEDAVYCDIGRYRGSYITTENSITLNNGDICYAEDANYVDSRSSYYHNEETVYSEMIAEYLLQDDAVYSEIYQDYLNHDDTIYLEYCEDYICKNDVVYCKLHNMDIYEDHATYCTETEQYYLNHEFLKVA